MHVIWVHVICFFHDNGFHSPLLIKLLQTYQYFKLSILTFYLKTCHILSLNITIFVYSNAPTGLSLIFICMYDKTSRLLFVAIILKLNS